MTSVTDRFQRGAVIGRGNFGIVYKGYDREKRQVVAIKVLDLDTVHDEVDDVQREIAMLAELSCHSNVNITQYYGSYLDGTKLWIIMDLCAGGSIRTLLKPGPLDEKYIAVLFRELLLAVSYIHSKGIIHRDIKAANVLVTTSGHLRLCDFGVAADTSLTNNKRMTMVGTPYWMAPEVIIEGQSYTNKADIWSAGITLYETATGNPPYSDQEAMRAMMLITKSQPPRLEGPRYSPQLKDVVAQCLDENPAERPSADALLKHKFIKSWAKTPATALQDLVVRYQRWKEHNAHARDSLILNQNYEHAAVPESDHYGTIDDDTVWDFHIDEVASGHSPEESLTDAPASIQALFGVETPTPSELGLRSEAISKPTSPKTTLERQGIPIMATAISSENRSRATSETGAPNVNRPWLSVRTLSHPSLPTQNVVAGPPLPIPTSGQSIPNLGLSKNGSVTPSASGLATPVSTNSPGDGSRINPYFAAASIPSRQNSVVKETPKFPHTQQLPTRAFRALSTGTSPQHATPITAAAPARRRSPSPKQSPPRLATSHPPPLPLKLVMPPRQLHHQAPLEFPSMPNIDFSVLLDSTQHETVRSQLHELLESFGTALKVVDNSLQ